MISASACGPLCQHPGCWKAKCAPPRPISVEDLPPSIETSEHELPTLSVSMIEPQRIYRHRSLPPIKKSVTYHNKILPQKSHSPYQCYQDKEGHIPRVSHIIVQAGFQCHSQKRWIWLPSLQSQQSIQEKSNTIVRPSLKDVTDELIQSRPVSSKVVHSRNMQTRLMNSRPKGSSYLDLVRKLGHLNLLDLPHYLQVKLLENTQFRKLLSSHPIDHLPYNALPDSVLLDLIRCQLSPQLPANPSLEGVGIFFDPPDDLAAKQEPKSVILPRRRCDWPEPSTYVPSTRVIEPSTLPGPQVKPAVVPNFREYVMKKRSSAATSVIDVQQCDAKTCNSKDECSTPHVTSVTTTIRDSSEGSQKLSEKCNEEEEDEDEEESLAITLPADEAGIRIPSAIEESEEPELMGITNSLPPTRDSWRHTSFSTVTPFSDHPRNSSTHDRDKSQTRPRLQAMTPPLENKTVSATSVLVLDCDTSITSILVLEGMDGEDGTISSPNGADSSPASPGIPPPTCTPINELADSPPE